MGLVVDHGGVGGHFAGAVDDLHFDAAVIERDAVRRQDAVELALLAAGEITGISVSF